MACFNPLKAYRSHSLGERDFEYSFNYPKSYLFQEIMYPCGKCIGCVKAHRQSWAMRLNHESYYHDVSSFVTLTYDESKVPLGEIPYDHFSQGFLRPLRLSSDNFIRFFCAAEYGTHTARPHFHAILFGFYPDDSVYWKDSKAGFPIHTSKFLSDIWGNGHVSLAPFSPATAGYVAGYVTKKVRLTQRSSRQVVSGYDLPEYHQSSRRPGMGHNWLMQYHADVLRDGYIIYQGRKVAIPRYYRKLLAKFWPDEYLDMSLRREEYFSEDIPDSSYDRLVVREQVQLSAARVSSRGSL